MSCYVVIFARSLVRKRERENEGYIHGDNSNEKQNGRIANESNTSKDELKTEVKAVTVIRCQSVGGN